ncbi:MAG TPA: N,N-dimethylformamidase beta subunit family domain-containing protein [Phototrophicaceae bacterium]|nr:N,N-dimethylformamidase beta subunit family domain-containing protein [Phototrophicaceae bacterium]
MFFLITILASLVFSFQPINPGCEAPANSVVAENCQAGTDDWRITSDVFGIEGYVSLESVTAGDTLEFFVNTTAPAFDLYIYRSGYYGGLGGRLVETIENLAGVQQVPCDVDAATGLITCSRWAASYRLTIPQEWVSGIYIGKLVRRDNGGENQILFVVRDDERASDILYQMSTTTYQAYNGYGGKSIYNFNSGECPTVSENARAVKTSMNRPYGSMIGSVFNPNIYDYVEYPLVHWLESQGYDVTYSTNLDTHRSGLPNAKNALLSHKLFVSSGHDEYWTQEMRNAVTAARDAGVNLAFFSSNVAYWRIRLENDPITGKADSVMVGYKTTESGQPDPVMATGTYRDPAGVNNPENELVGIQYMGDNGQIFFPVRVTTEQGQDRIYRNTGLDAMPANTYINLGKNLVGWEWDQVVDNGHTPDGLTILAESPSYGAKLMDAGRYYDVSTNVSHITRYTAPSGATVFATGTNQFSWGLAIVEPNPIIQQMVYNVFADMGIQPATPAETLIIDGATDGQTPQLDQASFISNAIDNQAPVISNIQVNAREFEATVQWETDVPTSGQVWVRVAADSADQDVFPPPPLIGVQASHTDTRLQHELTFGGLERGANYTLQLISADEMGHVVITEPVNFSADTGGTTGQIRMLFKPIIRATRCLYDTNPAAVISLAVGGLVLALVMGGSIVFMLRRRRPA